MACSGCKMNVPEHIDAVQYLNCMEEIKLRVRITDDALREAIVHERGTFPNVELAALQMRKIYELIAFSSIAANRTEYEQIRTIFQKDWKLSSVVKTLKKVNPDFLPVPLLAEGDQPNYVFKNSREREISEAELVKCHGRLGDLLHASNPYRDLPDFRVIGCRLSQERNKIVECLCRHTITLKAPKDVLYFVELMSEGEKPRITSLFQDRDSDVQ